MEVSVEVSVCDREPLYLVVMARGVALEASARCAAASFPVPNLGNMKHLLFRKDRTDTKVRPPRRATLDFPTTGDRGAVLTLVCVECLIGKQKKPILFEVVCVECLIGKQNKPTLFIIANREPISGQIFWRVPPAGGTAAPFVGADLRV